MHLSSFGPRSWKGILGMPLFVRNSLFRLLPQTSSPNRQFALSSSGQLAQQVLGAIIMATFLLSLPASPFLSGTIMSQAGISVYVLECNSFLAHAYLIRVVYCFWVICTFNSFYNILFSPMGKSASGLPRKRRLFIGGRWAQIPNFPTVTLRTIVLE